MNKVAIAIGLLLLAADGSALAQGGRNNGTGADRPAIEAPVGHRQPRASDFRDETNLSNPNDQANKEDEDEKDKK